MKKLALFTLLLLFAGLAFGQNPVPTCNSFDATGAPIYSTAGYPDTNGTTACTDFFGVANYANSPLPVGPVDTTFTIMNGGSGYCATATGSITDFYATPGASGAVISAVTVTNGVVTAVAGGGGSGYMAPVVTITDCAGGTGAGAVVLAKLASATAGGIHKFVDTLPTPSVTPLAGLALATPDVTTFPGSATSPASDYYEIALVQAQWPMHSDLPATTVRGYVQLPTGSTACPTAPAFTYLGPVILAQKNRPVRVKFTNCLPSVAAGGNLFIPTDLTYMGAGVGPDGVSPYLQNRATLHLHGGATPWISDGTPHQWTVPAIDFGTKLNRGVSTRFVPDMWFDANGAVVPGCAGQTTCAGATTDPGPGAMTFFWTNQQGGRLMFYHDHAYGITRLNVYAGEAAGFLLTDPVEEAALVAATVPGTVVLDQTLITPANPFGIKSADLAHLIPLVIQDKTFVPNPDQLAAEDPSWIGNFGTGNTTVLANGANGDLWFNHVYPPNQNPNDLSGANAFGRWDYGAWFFPPQNVLTAANPPTAITIPCTSAAYPGQLLAPTTANPVGGCPIIPNPTGTPESFMDTPVVNGKAYPVLHVAPEAYRFRILSAGNDRSLNLSLFLACGSGTFSAAATNCAAPGATGTEVPMVPAVQGGLGTAGYVYPDQLDGRLGGVPDSAAAGPPWIQIGTEGGLLPKVAVIPPTPVGYEYNRRSITVTNVSSHGLLLGPAERADVVVDFTGYPSGTTIILYNDSPAPIPAFDPRIDYFTGDPDQVQQGGAPTTLPGYGPNTRTIMKIVVDQPASGAPAFSLATLQNGNPTAVPPVLGLPDIFKVTQPAPIVPEPTYPVASGGNSPTATYARIQDNTITYTPVGGVQTTYTFDQKAIQELFTLDYGRMNATLGVELPFTNFLTQTTIPYGYVDWPTEIMRDGQTQIWKITHNGVDTHFIHFHLFNVQVINRIGWDGAVKPPDPNELGWKDTVRMNPLEDIAFAMQPIKQNLPLPIPDSIRSMDVTMPDAQPDLAISGLDPASGNATITNVNNPVNFGWEYVWHCHILGHEENDMMRPIIFQVAPPAPANLAAVANITGGVNVSWTDNSANETGFNLQRDIDPAFPNPVNLLANASASVPSSAFGGIITFVDSAVPSGTVYYRVQSLDDFTPNSPLIAPFQTVAMASAWVGPVPFTANPIAGVTPTALNFGNVVVNATGGPLSVTLSNTGTSALAINSILLGGASASQFSLPTSANPCGASLNPGATCTIDVTFTPNAVGPQSASVTISSNDPVNGTLNVALSGVGIANTATAILAPAITYGANGVVTVNVTSPQVTPVTGTVTLSVDGGAPLSQALVSGSATFTLTAPLAGSHTLAANYAAQGGFGASSATGTLTVNPAALTITASSGTMIYGGAVPAITPTYSGFVLGQGPTNLTGTVICSTTATSASPVGSYPSSCSGATSTNYAITYVPGVVAISKATSATTITSNLPNPSILGQIVTVSFRVAPQFTGTPTGNVRVTASTGQTCTGALTLGVGSCTLSFSTGGSRTLTAAYLGDANFAGSTSAAATQVVSSVSLSTRSLLFGNQLVGTLSAAQTVTLANVGTTPLAISNITWSANFSHTNNCPRSLAPGASCRINVRFAPTTTGVLTGTLTIADSDVTSPQVVTLTGTGVQPAAVLTPTSWNFGTVLRRQSSTHGFTLSNPGTAPLTISSISIGGANANQYSQTNTCGGSLAVGASCTITVRFSPNQRGVLNATLNVTDNAPGTASATLTGTGQ